MSDLSKNEAACPFPFPSEAVLRGAEGDLLLVRVSVEPRLLEDALESLAGTDFPINPQIYHGRPTVIEFPAYSPWLAGITERLRIDGFSADQVRATPMLAAIAAA